MAGTGNRKLWEGAIIRNSLHILDRAYCANLAIGTHWAPPTRPSRFCLSSWREVRT